MPVDIWKRWAGWLFALVGAWYVVLGFIHWWGARPLWNDERVVFLSVQQYSSFDLFHRTLMVDQTFPRLYLWCIQRLSSIFDFSLLSLRFLSLVSMLIAFFVWARAARREFSAHRFFLLFLLSWIASTPLVYYTAELKQYSMDVCAAGLWLLFLQAQPRLASGSLGRYCAILCLMPLLGLFSYPAFLFFVFPFWHISRSRGSLVPLFVYGAACLFVMGVSYTFDVRLCSTVMVNTYNDHFIWFDSPGRFVSTFFEGVNDLASRWFASRPTWIRGVTRFFMALAFVEMFMGAIAFFRRKEAELSLHAITFIVFMELALLGALHKYPFSVTRTSLFFFPLLLMMVFKGLERWEGRYVWFSRGLQAVYLLFVCLLALRVAGMVFSGVLSME